MNLETEFHEAQVALWPAQGQHILAQFDHDTIVVYQAYNREIGEDAVRNGAIGGGPAFSFNRMSWIKPNFLWMMYRSGWGQKDNQQMTLGLRISRSFFETILGQAVASSMSQSHITDAAEWKAAIASSDVRLQWDPDHNPAGAPQSRRAIQLGLRGPVLKEFCGPQMIEVIDLSSFVATQREALAAGQALLTPRERVYTPTDPSIAARLHLD